MNNKPAAHFIDNYLINPTNAVTVTLIGAGGTGSRMLSALHSLHAALLALHRPGLFVTVYDHDQITEANLGRQLFMQTELGMNKAVAIVNRFNRCFGTGWKAVAEKFDHITARPANITISCVDEVSPRFEIADILTKWKESRISPIYEPLYWMDFGNGKSTGQVILSTVSTIAQPKSKQFQARSTLALPTVEFKTLWEAGRDKGDQPSCSLAEALTKQDLFINPILAAWGGQLLTDMFTKGMINVRGIFVNANTYRTQPLPVI
jgi:PRTRC genetic system ThiF family protein